jgi:xanthine dehydrogenase accessory factor
MDLAARVAELRTLRVPFVRATVVLAERPTSAKPGDQAIVLADGTIEGFVGGTCSEATVRNQALVLLDRGGTLLVRITADADLRPESSPQSPPSAPTAPAASRIGTPAAQLPGGDGVGAGEGKLVVHNPCLSGGTLEVFLEPVVPAPLVAVIGTSPIARALIAIAGPLGYDVADAVTEAASAVVVATHGRDEEDALLAAIAADVPYVGLVASRKRGEAVVASLDACGGKKSRIRTPAGLDLGARTPEEIALSILAEIVAARPRPSGRPVEASDASETSTSLDPVCGMSVATVDASLHLDHDGQRVWFCGSGCMRAFAADPGAYVST